MKAAHSVSAIAAWLAKVAPDARELRLDSRKLVRGEVFVAVSGAKIDGRDFIEQAIARGAVAVLAEGDAGSSAPRAVPVLEVAGLKDLLGPLAAQFYGWPSRRLLAIGVTGTNGKTSSSQWIAQLLTRLGRRCAVIGTIGAGFAGEDLADFGLTTPDAVSLQSSVRALADAGAQALAMEVSSIGLDQGRAAGMAFRIALFTNLTRDHLDYHGSMAAYEEAKAKLFDWPGLEHAVINVDDEAGRRYLDRCVARGVNTIAATIEGRCAASAAACLAAEDIRTTAAGLAFTVRWGEETARVAVRLVGSFNVANLLGVIGVALAAGYPLTEICAQLGALIPPPGRMQQIDVPGAPLAVVDYAHTPDALIQAGAALRPLAAARGGKLWVVMGAGGDRDPGKRAPMGAAAAQSADRVVVTSDNPRSEDPASIVAQVAAGAPQAERIVDRAAAIAHAIASAAPADVVLIAGKGHEDYQDIAGSKIHFSDLEEARIALEARTQEARPC